MSSAIEAENRAPSTLLVRLPFSRCRDGPVAQTTLRLPLRVLQVSLIPQAALDFAGGCAAASAGGATSGVAPRRGLF
jgi:hypothetical protein